MEEAKLLENPFRPGAGHMPPYLAGRDNEIETFKKLLKQDVILHNLIITGLRGTGKTVLLETLKPIAIQNERYWIGTDLSESVCINETNMAIRILTDLSIATSGLKILIPKDKPIGFQTSDGKEEMDEITIDYNFLAHLYEQQPGLVADKLKFILEFVWNQLQHATGNFKGVIFAYDEAQNLSDHVDKEQYPLSILLDIFQSIQRKGIPFMLVLSGLPNLFSKLVDVRTYSERMFMIIELSNLNDEESKKAIKIPTEKGILSLQFSESSIQTIIKESGGYPYFIQFICRECFDTFLFQIERGTPPKVPVAEIISKLDTDFFSARWTRASDRERELLRVIAKIEIILNSKEFSVGDILSKMSEIINKPFSSSQTSQYLGKLIEKGLIHKTRYGKYSFAVPLLGGFINRQYITETETENITESEPKIV